MYYFTFNLFNVFDSKTIQSEIGINKVEIWILNNILTICYVILSKWGYAAFVLSAVCTIKSSR